MFSVFWWLRLSHVSSATQTVDVPPDLGKAGLTAVPCAKLLQAARGMSVFTRWQGHSLFALSPFEQDVLLVLGRKPEYRRCFLISSFYAKVVRELIALFLDSFSV